jgi:hypothetical protein
MAIVRVPIAGIDVTLRAPTGAEDMLLVESGFPDFGVALGLLSRVASTADGRPIDWQTIAVTDVDVLLLRLRQEILGDLVRADARCSNSACGARVDIEFSITAYLDHHRPREARRITAPDDSGWLRLDTGEAEFRPPRAADQIAVALEPQPVLALIRQCLRPADAPPAVRRRVEAVLEAIAPDLCSELQGSCPECGVTVTWTFDPLQYTLRELRNRASLVYEDVCMIARYTHWSEAEILSLPTMRRTRYADIVHEAGVRG